MNESGKKGNWNILANLLLWRKTSFDIWTALLDFQSLLSQTYVDFLFSLLMQMECSVLFWQSLSFRNIFSTSNLYHSKRLFYLYLFPPTLNVLWPRISSICLIIRLTYNFDRFTPVSESRLVENIFDSCQNIYQLHDDPRRSLCQGQPVSQQHACGWCDSVHQCPSQLSCSRGKYCQGIVMPTTYAQTGLEWFA